MAYSTLPTVNPGDLISSSTWGNIVKNDIEFLFNGRAANAAGYAPGARYTTTSTSFVVVDGTNLVKTATITTGRALLLFAAEASQGVMLDIELDGARIGPANGIVYSWGQNVHIGKLFTGLSAGSHTWKVMWRVASGTGYIATDQSLTYDATNINFDVVEL